MNFLIGADPELFIVNKKTKQFVSAEGIIPGTKERPFEVESGAVQVDGLAAEFNINPAENEDEFVKNTVTVLAQLSEMIKEVDSDLELSIRPYAEFDKDYFEQVPAFSKVLGCEPDFNVMGQTNEVPENQDLPFRTAAAHIHVGWTSHKTIDDQIHFNDCLMVASVFHEQGLEWWICNDPELQRKRLQYYGHSGAFRAKPYGLELRSPDNSWISKEELMRTMYRRVIHTMGTIGA